MKYDSIFSPEFAKSFAESISSCMRKAIEEDPEGSKNWSAEELWEKGSNWAGRHVLITEIPPHDESDKK